MSIGADLIRGHTEAIILSLLREKNSYGYEINKTISQVSGGRYELKEATLYSLHYIASSSVEKLYTFSVTEEVLEELVSVADQYRKRFMDREFKSLEILKTLC